MALSARIQLKQSQSLVMTPQLMQSIKLLQLSNVELAEFVAGEVEKNPLLELERDDNAGAGDGAGDRVGDGAGETANLVQPMDVSRSGLDDVIAASTGLDRESLENGLDGGSENLYDGEAGNGTEANQPSSAMAMSGMGPGHASSEGYNLEEFVSSTQNMYELLIAQAMMEFHSEPSRRIAIEIIGALDDDGYLREPTADIAAALDLPHSHVLGILKRVQGLEPAGIAARDLKECLALQLIEKNRFDPAMEVMVNNLDLLARRDYHRLRQLCGVNEEDFIDMIAEIRDLDPRPGLGLRGDPAEIVVPDVLVKENREGGWSVELNQETLPRVLVNRNYYAEVTSALKGAQEKEFMVDCLQNANWLVKSLDQRAQTILKVAAEIVKQQDLFFAYGIEHMRPLNLKTVADAIAMHESTVSRVTSNKYMLTSRGLFELKYFFTTGIASSDGSSEHSSQSVKHHIRRMIDGEVPAKILSDDAIVDELKTIGIDVARRTVAKYREAMNIPSSVQRRREKQAMKLAKAI